MDAVAGKKGKPLAREARAQARRILAVSVREGKPAFDPAVEQERIAHLLERAAVPGYNDDEKKLTALAKWIADSLGANTPWHLARFVPEYRLAGVPRTPLASLERLRALALDAGLRYVYLSNVAPHEGNHTYCGHCGARVVERLGFRLLRNDLSKSGGCPHCHRRLPGVWS